MWYVREQLNRQHMHIHEHSLFPKHQSAYRKNHSTETALLKIKNDILLGMNSQEVTLLVLADLSSAFDTVEHSNLLSRLQTKAGVAGRVLDWLKSYMTGRSQRVSVQGSESNKFAPGCGIPQGSRLGYFLFLIYTSECLMSSSDTSLMPTAMLMTLRYTFHSRLRVEKALMQLLQYVI